MHLTSSSPASPDAEPIALKHDLGEVRRAEADGGEHLFGDYDLLCLPGQGRELLISVVSMGDPGQLPPFEWLNTIQQLGGDQHVLFVRDKVKSWYNSENGWVELIDWIRLYCIRHDIHRIYSFGVSMGGFGAAILAAYLPISHVLMLSPQAAVDNTAAFDPRFRIYWNVLTNPRHPNLAITETDTRFTCIFTVDDLFDVLHAAAIRRMIKQCRFVPIHGDHNVGGELRHRGEHLDVLRWLMGRQPKIRVTKAKCTASSAFHFARLITDGRWDLVQAAIDKMVQNKAEASCPGMAYPALEKALMHRIAQEQPTYSATKANHAYPAAVGTTAIAGALTPYLESGWSKVQFQGFWSEGKSARLRLRIVDYRDGQKITIEMVGFLFVAPGRKRRCRIRHNGGVVATRLVENPHDSPYNAPVSFRFTVLGPLIELDIETPEPLSPAAVSDLPDTRELGLWLRYLSVL